MCYVHVHVLCTYYVHVCFIESSENAKSSVRPLGGSRNKKLTRSTVDMAPVGYSHVEDRLLLFVLIQ